MVNKKTKLKSNDSPHPGEDNDSYHHGHLRQALIDTGLDMIREQGLHSLSLRETARKAGVSEAAPYRHFANKESLIAAIAEDGFEKLHNSLQTAGSPNSTPTELLQARAWAYVNFALKETDHFHTMYSSSLTPPHAEKHPELVQTAMVAFKSLMEVIKDCQKDGSIHADIDPRTAAIRLWASIHGFTLLMVDHQLEVLGVTPSNARAVVRGHMDTLLAGLRQSPH